MKMMIFFGLLVSGYIGGRMIIPLPCKKHWKILLAAGLFLISMKFHLLYLFGGGSMFFAPSLPSWIQLPVCWLFAVVFILFFLLLLIEIPGDIVRLICYFLHKGTKEQWRKVRLVIHAVLLVLSLILASFGLYNGTADPEVREVSVVLPDLPDDADGMTIAVLADIHADRITNAKRVAEMVRRTNALKPDVVVIAGDFVDGSIDERAADLEPLSMLSAPLGVYGIPGNHEYYSGYDAWMTHLEKLSIRMLCNEHVMLRPGVALAGITDKQAKRFQQEEPDLKKVLNGTENIPVRILLAHQPKMAEESAEAGVDLQISGHTHGGMIWGVDRIVAALNHGYAAGEYKVGDEILYVNRGSGIWNGFPIRLGVPAEITLLHLKKK